MTVPVAALVRTALVAAAGAGVVLAATQHDGAFAIGSGARTTSPAPASAAVRDASLLCPGPELRGVPGLDDESVPVGVAAVTAPDRLLGSTRPLGAGGRVSLRTMPGGAAQGSPATQRGASTSATVGASAGVQVRATQNLAPGLAAAQSWLEPSGDRRALSVTGCGDPGSDLWLLAGGGAPGRQERLVLTNPGGNPVSVDVTLHGDKGPVASPGGSGLVVPAHGRTAFLLDSISSDLADPAVHVVAHGGVVGAVVADTWLDGTRAAGSDDAVPSAAPSREQVVPAVSVNGRATLRVVVPGRDEAVVQARVLTKDGPRALPAGGVVRVDGGAVHDIDLSGLPSGSVALQVRADHPVVAAAMVVRDAPGKPGDLAWTSSTPAISAVAGMPLAKPAGAPDGFVLHRTLLLTATGAPAGVEVVTVDGSGTATSNRVSVAADSTTTVDVTAASSVWVHRVSGSGAVRAGVVSWGNDSCGTLISSTPLRDATLRSTTVAVREAPQG
ncbi:DUF5719 family protein [Phycicoccus sp. M110.8]|uniref:DUF5719 family protein n=1 Tax=Phycicoccus sp. M110.8 TaxID=3075433 RepID=UPI0028FD4F5F|nr:DUF5719 family protein [Phycicoccus sp. M110.8]MDU0312680.1 DUF5719 family protein [Phycicoccus sp. M110.8]